MKKDFFNKIKSSSKNTIEPERLLKRVIEGKNFGKKGDPIEFYDFLEDKMKEAKEESPHENFLENIFDCHHETVVRCKACGSEKQKLKLSSSIVIRGDDIPQCFAKKERSHGRCE